MAVALLAVASLVSELATLSFSMREKARFFSRSLSQFVVRGVLGRSQKPRMATTAVTAPSTMKSLGSFCQSWFFDFLVENEKIISG